MSTPEGAPHRPPEPLSIYDQEPYLSMHTEAERALLKKMEASEPKAPEKTVDDEGDDEDELEEEYDTETGNSDKELDELEKEHKRAIEEADRKALEDKKEEIKAKWPPDDGTGKSAIPEASGYGETAVAATGLATMGILGWISKKTQHTASGFFTAIEEYGQAKLKKSAPWLKYIPFVGKWLLKDVVKSMAKREEEEKKKKEADDKKNKSANDKSKKDLEAKTKKIEDQLKKDETTAAKKIKDDEAKHKKTLEGNMTPLQKYTYTNSAAEEEKEAILKAVEADLPRIEAERKESEYENMLAMHMSPEEQTEFQKKPTTDDERIARTELRNKVISELETPERQKLAKENQAKKGKGKNKGGDKGKGGGGGGRGRKDSGGT